VVAVAALKLASNTMARERAEAVVAAANAFHTAQSRYPHTLEELVPRYLPDVPRAKYTWISGRFRYVYDDGGGQLSYMAVPPFGRRIYNFKTQRWSYLD